MPFEALKLDHETGLEAGKSSLLCERNNHDFQRLKVDNWNCRRRWHETVSPHVVCLVLPASRVNDEDATVVGVFQGVHVPSVEDVWDSLDDEGVSVFGRQGCFSAV